MKIISRNFKKKPEYIQLVAFLVLFYYVLKQINTTVSILGIYFYHHSFL